MNAYRLNYHSKLFQLVQKLRILPGVGAKSAQRIALHLLTQKRPETLELVALLQEALQLLKECQYCHFLTEYDLCEICQDVRRNPKLLCVVVSQADIFALEQSGGFNGKYHILKGYLSPLDGIDAAAIGIPHLIERIQEQQISEIILAMNSTVESQATVHYLMESCKHLDVLISKVAQGIPQSGELEYLDSHTLIQAISHRLVLKPLA